MIKLAICGCLGRMGQRITTFAKQDSIFILQTLLEHPNHPQIGQSNDGIIIQSDINQIKNCDVLIDFTSPSSTMENVTFCKQFGVKLVIGTTGLTGAEVEILKETAQTIPIVYSSNMSIGVNILFTLAKQLSSAAPENYTVKIIEAHHVHKKDAPSGTAKTLATIIENNSNRAVSNIESIRQGEIIGDHKVIFESAEDVIVIEHHAKTRDIFAKGALVAAQFVQNKSKGFYSMHDVLGLS
jgi:4-hydroxy-tetrahydrodipicolinate reductase